MAQSPYACLHGSEVRLSGKTGPFRACPYDGEETGQVRLIGGNPHHAQVVCTTCNMHVSWLSRDHLDAMLAKRGAAA